MEPLQSHVAALRQLCGFLNTSRDLGLVVWSVLLFRFTPPLASVQHAVLLMIVAMGWWTAAPNQKWRRLWIPVAVAGFVAVLHFTQRPRVEAAWSDEHSHPPSTSVTRGKSGLVYSIEGVRTRDQHGIRYEPKRVPVEQVQRVWLGVQHFTIISPIAHTFVSFELTSGERLAVSTEARRTTSQRYSPLRGLFRAYGLIAVVGSEEEVTGRAFGPTPEGEEFPLYLYETVATPEQSQAMFIAVMDRINEMRARPEFYNTLTNNCTTNIVDCCNEVAPVRVSALNPRIMLPGYTGAAAYRHGLLDTTQPFRDLKRKAANARR